MHFFVTPDWRPVPHLIRVGYQSHSAYRLLLPLGLTAHDALIRRMAHPDHGQRDPVRARPGWRGLSTTPPPAPSDGAARYEIRVRRRTWWVQMEALKGLLAVSRVASDPERLPAAVRGTMAVHPEALPRRDVRRRVHARTRQRARLGAEVRRAAGAGRVHPQGRRVEGRLARGAGAAVLHRDVRCLDLPDEAAARTDGRRWHCCSAFWRCWSRSRHSGRPRSGMRWPGWGRRVGSPTPGC